MTPLLEILFSTDLIAASARAFSAIGSSGFGATLATESLLMVPDLTRSAPDVLALLRLGAPDISADTDERLRGSRIAGSALQEELCVR